MQQISINPISMASISRKLYDIDEKVIRIYNRLQNRCRKSVSLSKSNIVEEILARESKIQQIS